MWDMLLPIVMSGLFSGSLFGGGVAWYNARQSKIARISGDERDARRDMITDRDALLDRALVRERELEARMDTLEARLDVRDQLVEDLYDHINILEDHIWKGHSPPPPPRPVST